MMSQPRKQAITMYILHNTVRSTGNQRTKFGQLRKHDVELSFLKNHAENDSEIQ